MSIALPTKLPTAVDSLGLPPTLASRADTAVPSHHVYFYQNDAQLCDAVTDYLRSALESGALLVVIATSAHWAAFRRELRAKGVDLERAVADRQLTVLDAHETLSRFMRGALPDSELFQETIGSLLQQCASDRDVPIRAYGEMVDVLWQEGNPSAAIRLEELWNDLQRTQPFSLLCAYGRQQFHGQLAGIRDICAVHTHAFDCTAEPLLVDDMNALVAEIAQRKEMERALRESLDKLRLAQHEIHRREQDLKDFVENATVPLHWVGPDGTILWANRAELELLGYAQDEYVGHAISNYHVDRPVIDTILARLERREVLHDFPARLRAKDGSIKNVLVSSSVYERDGKFVHTRCFTHDVTEQTRIEADRNASAHRTARLLKITAAIADAVLPEQVYEAIVDRVAAALGATTAALWVVGGDGKAQLVRSTGYADAALVRFGTLSPESEERTPALDAIRQNKLIWIDSQQDLLERYPSLATAVTSGSAYRICCLPIGLQGQCYGALAFTFETDSIDHQPQNFLMLVAGYTSQALERLSLLQAEQKSRVQAEATAARAGLLYRLAAALIMAERVEDVFESGLDAIAAALGTERSSILVLGEDGVMRFKAWRALSDEYRKAVEGHSPWRRDERAPQPVLVPDVTTDDTLSAYLPLFREERIRALGFIPLVANGRLLGKFMVYYEQPHEFAESEIAIAIAIAHHFAAAIARFEMVATLQQSVRFNEMFTGMLGHDLRNPLGAIMTAAQVAMQRQPDERLVKPLSRILTSGDRMARMIDQLLDFTRVRVGAGIPLEIKPFDLAVGLHQVIDELEDPNSGWKFHITDRGDLRGSWDGDRLLQVLSNLIANAVQHGAIASGVSIAIDGTASEFVRIDVHNMGAIAPALLAHVFEPMTGGDNRYRKSTGLGLGLYISREIVRAHQGRIDVQSSDIDGTRFTVVLPRLPGLSEREGTQ